MSADIRVAGDVFEDVKRAPSVPFEANRDDLPGNLYVSMDKWQWVIARIEADAKVIEAAERALERVREVIGIQSRRIGALETAREAKCEECPEREMCPPCPLACDALSQRDEIGGK